jgi:lysine biosynthesis protein LysW
MKTTHCLSCDSKIEIGSKAKIGQFVYCEFCGADFEIIELNPIELDYAFVDDDLDYDDEDDNYDSVFEDDDEADEDRQSQW